MKVFQRVAYFFFLRERNIRHERGLVLLQYRYILIIRLIIIKIVSIFYRHFQPINWSNLFNVFKFNI